MGLLHLFAWTFGTGTLVSLWSILFALQDDVDAYDYYICLAKAQRAFFLGCVAGAVVASFFPAMITEPLVALLLLSCAVLVVQQNNKK
jgi:uncharacterized membrane protein YfcA